MHPHLRFEALRCSIRTIIRHRLEKVVIHGRPDINKIAFLTIKKILMEQEFLYDYSEGKGFHQSLTTAYRTEQYPTTFVEVRFPTDRGYHKIRYESHSTQAVALYTYLAVDIGLSKYGFHDTWWAKDFKNSKRRLLKCFR